MVISYPEGKNCLTFFIKGKIKQENKMPDYRGLYYGFVIGDAFCAPYEFLTRGTFTPSDKYEPLPLVLRNGTFIEEGLTRDDARGIWTDDTSMSLCLLESLIRCGGHNAMSEMKNYTNWYKETFMSPVVNGIKLGCIDIGIQMRKMMCLFNETGEPYVGKYMPAGSGNGSLMRTPFAVMYFYARGFSEDDTVKNTLLCSKTTHDTLEVNEIVAFYTRMLYRALGGATLENILLLVPHKYYTTYPTNGGYIVGTIKSVVYILKNTSSYYEGIKLAALFGNDSDTVGCIYGALAGVLYGFKSIPKYLVNELNNSRIDDMFEEFQTKCIE